MKKIALILLFCLQLMSCAFPSYVSQDRKIQTGLDFHSGKWLLNTIDAPYPSDEKLTKIALKDFTKHLKNNLSYVPKTKGILLPRNITFDPTKKQLTDLKAGTNFDYFINVKAKVVKEEIGAVDFSTHNHRGKSYRNEVTVIVEIYDLNNLEIIYSQTVNGSVQIVENSNDFYMAKTTDGLIVGAYKKIMKDINKKSI
ncbi:hypothetical protein BC749_102289 [Flavobacterium araucananum]|uniref:Uncharacterized protein n=1 Tax=Flavobacterium araucananum TaxID=946678 RepID=A0A227NS79_9FLAO|nr:hypothetical protein [Flavobacterium araucananum]OXG00143.1 hypothetical protein B0A64_20405 [Flavobacterium araucananum]PWK00724.1 hypothetical protein BC749_102289 [Flavobacterium araucananum]